MLPPQKSTYTRALVSLHYFMQSLEPRPYEPLVLECSGA